MTFARTARPARRLAPGAGAPYFDTLAGYADILRTVSLDDRISGRALGLYRLLGMGLFYAVDYLVRPWRLLVTLRNVFRQQQESRLEMSLRDLVYQLLGRAAGRNDSAARNAPAILPPDRS